MKHHDVDEILIWKQVLLETQKHASQNPAMQKLLKKLILSQKSISHSLATIISKKLSNKYLPQRKLYSIIYDIYKNNPTIVQYALFDLQAFFDRDPACEYYSSVLLFYKGYHALQSHRIAHELWKQKQVFFAYYFQYTCSQIWGVDIHPAAKIGRGIFIDHATSLVIGETVVIDDYVSLLHEVTLGGTGKEQVDRHPKIRTGAMIGAGAKILGNIEIGANSKVGAGSVVLKNAPAQHTVVGVPARVVGKTKEETPSEEMNQEFGDF